VILSSEILADLLTLLGPERAFIDAATRSEYASDETPRSCMPEAVLFPSSHADVAAIVKLANHHGFPLVARGAGSGNLGGALPVPGGVVVSFECMNRIIEFDPASRLMVVEPGVVTDDIDALAATAGLMYAPDPGSGAYSRIGGNLATNAAGPRCVKYGATRDHVLGLRAVAGDGRELSVGSRTSKYATAYDLSRLLVGSEGTLALITEAILKLVPAPETVATLRVCYADNAAACAAVMRVMAQPVLPCALEFMDSRSLSAIREYGGAEGLPEGTRAVLMVEADGGHDDVPRQIAALEQALEATVCWRSRAASPPPTSSACGPRASPCPWPSRTSPPSRSTRTWWCPWRAWPTWSTPSTPWATITGCPSSASAMPATATCT
jgi:D-lactate dehydrogenase